MKYRYIVHDIDGNTYGTNDPVLAKKVAEEWDDFIVVDVEEGKLLPFQGLQTDSLDVKELQDDDEEEEPEDNEPDEDEWAANKGY